MRKLTALEIARRHNIAIRMSKLLDTRVMVTTYIINPTFAARKISQKANWAQS